MMWTWIALLLTGCGGSSSMEAGSAPATKQLMAKEMADEDMLYEVAEEEMAPPPPAAARSAPADEGAADGLMIIGGSRGERSGYGAGAARPRPSSKPGGKKDMAANGSGGGDDGPAVRQWFPESFLWQPLVETGADGTATVPVTVPDQLTTWRVLALAHSRDGQQAGALHTFDSRLPLYVEPVVPGWLYSGDSLSLPVQVVNTTTEPITAGLTVEATGALAGQRVGQVRLVAGGSSVETVRIAAEGAGASRVKALLTDADAVDRELRVMPEGRPVSTTRGGTLAGPRKFSLAGAEGADPATEELKVLVFPGPLAVLQSEIERAGTGGAHPWDPAYSFALASRLEALAAQTGNEIDATALRDLRVVGWQRVVREARSPDAGRAADLLASMQDVHDHELAEELRDRLIRVVRGGQRADGTWARQGTGSLQLVLAQTAFAARVLPEDETGSRLRASGVLERHLDDVEDAYTAAIWLASGVVEGTEADALRERLLEAVSEDATGAKTIAVPSGVVNPWGVRPSQAEMLAWTSLALADQELDWHGDLVAALMSGYDAAWGFGAGPADVIALEAVAEALPGLDGPAEITLSLDGKVVGTALLDPKQPKVPALLVAKTGGSNPAIELASSGATGLAFVATVDSWVPWTGDESLAGVEVEVEADDLKVGEDGVITLRLAAPSGVAVTLEQGLPAGAAIDEASTRARSQGIEKIDVLQDRVRVQTRRFSAGEVLEVKLIVRPAFAGSFATRPLRLEAGGRDVALPPFRWEVAG
ncbi:MAG: hypothetical protein EP330_09215 [Deltaproteobacteria bacterium]|nr:MAG: hypothetical protein EP330_09215 [Deltaproteobacteria bacterium]